MLDQVNGFIPSKTPSGGLTGLAVTRTKSGDGCAVLVNALSPLAQLGFASTRGEATKDHTLAGPRAAAGRRCGLRKNSLAFQRRASNPLDLVVCEQFQMHGYDGAGGNTEMPSIS